MENIVVCSHCGAKLKVKPGVKKVMKEIKCGKCRKSISLTTEPEANNASPQSSIQSSPTPTAPSDSTPPGADDAKKRTEAPPSSAAAPETAQAEKTTEPRPGTPSPAPKKEAAPTTAPSVPGPVPTTQPAAGPMFESRFAALEKKVEELQQVIDDLCKADANAAKRRIEEINRIAHRD